MAERRLNLDPKVIGSEQYSQSLERSFTYDPMSREIFDGERRHPFQEFLYALRDVSIRVSTSEWIDLQKILEADTVHSLDELYVVARALLIKDVTDYPAYDLVFGSLFYGIEPPSILLPDEIDEEYQDEIDVAEDREKEETPPPVQKPPEEIDEVAEAKTFTSENLHGGKEATKDIKNSPNAANNGVQAENHGAEKGVKNDVKGSGGKSGFASARELILSRKFEPFDKDEVINYQQFGRVLARLKTLLQEATKVQTRRIDESLTIDNIAANAGLPELVFQTESEEKPNIMLLFDVGGSTDKFRPIMEKLFAGAKDALGNVEIYYFHNIFYGEVWMQKDGNWGQHYIPISKILQKDSSYRTIIIGDAWMAQNELPNESLAELKQLTNKLPTT